MSQRARVIVLLLIAIMKGPSSARAESWQLQDLMDPFWDGYSASLRYSLELPAGGARNSIGLRLARGWLSGVAVVLDAPIVLTESSAAISGARAPRIGGGSLQRLEVRGLFRIAGNSESFASVQLGVGLPFQTDGSMAASIFASWVFTPGFHFQWASDPWIISGGILAARFLPAVIPSTGGTKVFLSPETQFILNLRVTFRFSPRWDVYVDLVEAPPFSVAMGIHNSPTALTFANPTVGRTRRVAVGGDVQLGHLGGNAMVLVLEGAYTLESMTGESNVWEGGGRIVWNW